MNRWYQSIFAALIFGALALAFTIVGVLVGPADVQVGGVRPENTIAPHLVELAGFGLLLGIGSLVVYGRKRIPLVFLIPSLVVLLDLDHLPVYLGYSEPIRPAHSLVFLAVALALTAVTIRALDIELAIVTAFMGHLAVDTGLFAPLSPLSFDYVNLTPYRIPLGAGAVLLTIAAGVFLRLRARGGRDV